MQVHSTTSTPSLSTEPSHISSSGPHSNAPDQASRVSRQAATFESGRPLPFKPFSVVGTGATAQGALDSATKALNVETHGGRAAVRDVETHTFASRALRDPGTSQAVVLNGLVQKWEGPEDYSPFARISGEAEAAPGSAVPRPTYSPDNWASRGWPPIEKGRPLNSPPAGSQASHTTPPGSGKTTHTRPVTGFSISHDWQDAVQQATNNAHGQCHASNGNTSATASSTYSGTGADKGKTLAIAQATCDMTGWEEAPDPLSEPLI